MTFKIKNSVAAIVMACLSGGAGAAWDYEDIWWDANQSGMGFFVGHQGNRVGVGWFHYADDGKATYLIFSGDLVNGTAQGNLERSTGPVPSPSYDPNQVVRTNVGNATLTFNSADSATFSYSYDGRAGTMNLTRMTFSDTTVSSGIWPFVGITVETNCSEPGSVTYLDNGLITVSAPGTGGQQTLTIAFEDDDTCTVTPTSIYRAGSLLFGNASVACGYGSGTGSFTTRLVGDRFMNSEYSLQMSGGCTLETKMSAIKQ